MIAQRQWKKWRVDLKSLVQGAPSLSNARQLEGTDVQGDHYGCRYVIRAAPVACWCCLWGVWQRRSCRWMSRCLICCDSLIGWGSGCKGAAWFRAQCGRWTDEQSKCDRGCMVQSRQRSGVDPRSSVRDFRRWFPSCRCMTASWWSGRGSRRPSSRSLFGSRRRTAQAWETER